MARVTGVYFSNWSIYGANFWPTDLDFANLTHVFYAFLKINPDGKIAFSDEWADLQSPVKGSDINGCVNYLKEARKEHPHLKLIFSVGGWGRAGEFQNMIKDSGKKDNFIKSSVKLVREYGFDGLDVDWEFPETAAEAAHFVDILKRLSEGLYNTKDALRGSPPGPPILTVATPASTQYLNIMQMQQMNRYLTFWNVMAYDFTGPWSSKTGYHSNLRGHNGDTNMSCEVAIANYTAKGISARKLVLGMPMYGRNFKKPKAGKVGFPFDKNIEESKAITDYKILVESAIPKSYDSKAVSAYYYDPSKRVFTTFDNVESVRQKAKFVKNLGLKGGFFWEAKGDMKDERSLLKAFVLELNQK